MASDSTPQYTVLARRFRPQSFSDVVGQEHVSQSIQNAIRSGRVAHAYLFTGARGVGKTSTARILAKALNCPSAVDGVPCNQCEVCDAISVGSDVDVLEIDGASNRGIDDIRQLRQNVNVKSMRSPNKVYIIDEVHMLTKEAFNALLKTLEEPPPNVKFIFCTTEPSKVPDTILSRCQRFDFGTIAASSIAGRLREIATAEGKEVHEDAIELVARRAAGSMRDSQSLFDQLLAFGGDTITAADVHQLLGTAPDDRMIELVEAAITNQPHLALDLLEAALGHGAQIASLSDQLLAYLRDLLVTAAGAAELPLSAVTESSRAKVKDQAQRWGLHTISAAMQILAETKAKMFRSNYGRALMELALVRMSTLERLDEIAALVQQMGTGGTGAAAPTTAKPAPMQALRDSFAKKKPPELNGPAGAAALQAPAPAPAAFPPDPVAARPPIAAEPASPVVTPAPAAEPVPGPPRVLEEKLLPELWEEMLRKTPEAVRSILQKSSRRAISGPNRLDILFPKAYAFDQKKCDRAETRQSISAAAGLFNGKPLDVRTGIDEAAAAVPKATQTPKSIQPERLRNSIVDTDPFVQSALSIFGAKVAQVVPLLDAVVSAENSLPPDDEPA